MTEDELIAAILSVSMMTRAEAKQSLSLPVRSTALDSLDLESLRTIIEKKLSRPIEDRVWSECASLGQLLRWLHAGEKAPHAEAVE